MNADCRHIIPTLLVCILLCAVVSVPAQKKPKSGKAAVSTQKKSKTGRESSSSKKKTQPAAASKNVKGSSKLKQQEKKQSKSSTSTKTKKKDASKAGKTTGKKKADGTRTGSPSISTKQEELDRLRTEIRDCERRLDETRKKERNTKGEIDAYNKQTKLLQDLIARLKIKVAENQQEIEQSKQELLTTEQRLALLQQRYSRWIVNAYMRGRHHDAEILLSSGSLNTMLVRARYLGTLTRRKRSDADEIRRVRGQIKEQKERLEVKLTQQQHTVDEKKSEEVRLQRKVVERKDLLGRYTKDREAAQAELRKKQAAARKIEQLIAELVERERAKKAERSRKSAGGTGGGKSARGSKEKSVDLPSRPISETAFGRLKGRLPWPVSRGSLIAGFGEQKHPVLGTITINNGIDIGVPEGSPVRAVADGTVSVVFFIAGYGNLVIVNHDDGFLTVYAHLSNISVQKGARVKAGQTIARSAGGGSNPLVHFEVWFGKQKQNPLNWLAGR